jgi:DNA-binding XRE family transcriptional regulator
MKRTASKIFSRAPVRSPRPARKSAARPPSTRPPPRAAQARVRKLASHGEDAAAERLIARPHRDRAAGSEALIPLDVADRIAEGEHPIKVVREWRNLTQQQLADAVEITQGYLSGIENGARQGPLALHQKLARALGVPLLTLIRD